MALGDSITAGLFATPSELSKENLVVDAIEKPVRRFRGQPQRYLGTGALSFIPGFEEYRGISYAMGDDEGAETIPNASPCQSFHISDGLTEIRFLLVDDPLLQKRISQGHIP